MERHDPPRGDEGADGEGGRLAPPQALCHKIRNEASTVTSVGGKAGEGRQRAAERSRGIRREGGGCGAEASAGPRERSVGGAARAFRGEGSRGVGRNAHGERDARRIHGRGLSATRESALIRCKDTC
jgi:hypothetical protein